MNIVRHWTLLVCSVGALLASLPASGQTIIGVNTLIDAPDFDLVDGICDCDNVTPGPQCSLRAAVQNANMIGGWVIIGLGPQVYGLAFGGTDDVGVAGDLDIYSGTLSKLEIQGTGVTVISGAGLIAAGTPDRIIHITPTVAATCEVVLRDLTIQDAGGVLLGAGLRHQAGRAQLFNVWFDNCTANDAGGGVHVSSRESFEHVGGGYSDCDAAFNGGGVMIETPASATVTLDGISMFNCDVSNNGGGVRVNAGSIATIRNCSIGAANGAGSGGGISNRGVLAVTDTAVAANFASGTGGGVANNIGAELTMIRCGLIQNQANTAGGFNNAGKASLIDCTIRNNIADTGGGIFNAAPAATPLQVSGTTVSGNFATGPFGGGGYRGFGAMAMVNSTIATNSATSGFGGGIYFDSGLANIDIDSSTIAFNFAQVGGGGLFIDNALGASLAQFRNAILSNNTIGGGASNNFIGPFLPVSQGFNLDSDGSCGFALATDLAGVNPLLGPLQNNGGPTETLEIMPGSPAINTGDCTTMAGITLVLDQRGFARVPPCDRGAFETGALPPPPNDDCAMAAIVPAGNFPFPHFGATTDGPAEVCGFTGLPGQDSDVWFQFVSPCDATITVSIVPAPPSNPDRLLAIYDFCPTGPGLPPSLVCAQAVGGPPATGTLQMVAGQVIVIRAGMPNGNQGDSILDITLTCTCPADVNNDNQVNVADLLAVIASWGPCPGCPPASCPADVAPVGPPQGDCVINVSDLLLVISAWGPCP